MNPEILGSGVDYQIDSGIIQIDISRFKNPCDCGTLNHKYETNIYGIRKSKDKGVV